METEKKQKDIREKAFKRLFGVKRETFEQIKAILQKKYDRVHQKGGSPSKLSIDHKLTITLKYYREYRTMESIAADYRVSKSTLSQTIQWVEDTLNQEETFKLPEKKSPHRNTSENSMYRG